MSNEKLPAKMKSSEVTNGEQFDRVIPDATAIIIISNLSKKPIVLTKWRMRPFFVFLDKNIRYRFRFFFFRLEIKNC